MKRIVLPILLAATLRGADSHMPAMNAFTTESYTQLARSDANLILSPFNIATALSMALAGARGQTAQEIQSVLHIQYDSSYDAALGALLADLAKAGNIQGNELITANGLWVQKGLAIQPAFERTLADNYHAPATLVDFIANFEAARSQINAWTEEHTNQKIKNLFPAGSLDAQTRLVLTSAIYFYGKWQDPFITSSTQPAPFTLSAGGTTQANFMNQTSHFGYAETPSAQILEMRYAGTGIAFDVLLPKTVIGINGLEKSLTPGELDPLAGKPLYSECEGEPAEVPRRICVLSWEDTLDHGHAYHLLRQGRFLRNCFEKAAWQSPRSSTRLSSMFQNRGQKPLPPPELAFMPAPWSCPNRQLSSAPITRSSS
jgi:Serpin (serine protease inhibitor)